MKNRLNQDQLFNLISGFAWDKVDRMSLDDVKKAAADGLIAEFREIDGKIDQESALFILVGEMCNSDTDLVREQMRNAGVDDELADSVIVEYMG